MLDAIESWPVPDTVLGIARGLSGRRWVWREGDARTGLGIAQRFGLPEIAGRLLAGRGVAFDDVPTFLDPTLRALLPDPSRLADMDVAAARLARAVIAGETVGIFGDYDVDGACAAAICATVLRALGCGVAIHVPDRIREGYGPGPTGLAKLRAAGASLIVCVDCGTAADAVLATVTDADTIVLDHHKTEDVPRSTLATVNPNRLDCGSGLGHLCAAAIAFLSCVALLRALRRGGLPPGRETPDLLRLLDLVALATVCDVMPLTGINRAFVAQGLKVMARRERPGIAALLEVARCGTVDAAALGFGLGPRINAAGRIDVADLGVRLLLEDDPVAARAMALRLDEVNRQRQAVEAGVLDEAARAAEAQVAAGHAAILVAGDWHPGVVGIVAGRLRERFNRPACVTGMADGVAKGSGRSVPGLDLGAAVIAARQRGLLSSGGGHAMAAGFGLSPAGLPDFHAFLDERLAAARLLPGAEELAIEGALTAEGAAALAGEIGRLAPFGHGNPEPVFAVARARVTRADRLGSEGGVVRAWLAGEGGGRLKAMLFRGAPAVAEALMARDGRPLHVAGKLRLETWQGRTEPHLTVTDVAAVPG